MRLARKRNRLHLEGCGKGTQKMITLALNVVLVALGWLAPALEGLAEYGPCPAVQETRPGATSPKDDPKTLIIAGRVVDGLGRPVSGVKVSMTSILPSKARHTEAVILTGDNGRYSGTIARQDGDVYVEFEKDGYCYTSFSGTNPGHEDTTLYRKIRWEEVTMLPYRDDNAFDQGVRELFASEEWIEEADGKDKLLGFLFTHQDQFRPALRRVVQDARVGTSARDWLDLLGDPGDRDSFPEGRRFASKHEVKETDLVEAIKATARHFNFFNPKPEPIISVDIIAFTKGMDRVMVQIGVNRMALTGFTRRFVFQKVDKQWVLRSEEEVGHS